MSGGPSSAAAWQSRFALLLVVCAVLLAGRALPGESFKPTHDGLLNVQRIFEFERCVGDGQLPCRWVPDMGMGLGSPLFNYYPSLPTALGVLFRSLGASYSGAAHASAWLALFLASIGAYWMARGRLSAPASAASAVFYLWAPYFATDIFVRGALAEAFGLAMLPWIFGSLERMCRDDRHASAWMIVNALSWAALLQSHLLVAIMAAPLYAVWCSLHLRDTRLFPRLALSHALGLGLAAWFVLPVLFERDLVHLDAIIERYRWADYQNNFLTPAELFLGTIGWGAGPFRSDGGMAVRLGGWLWVFAVVAMASLLSPYARPDPKPAGVVSVASGALVLGVGGLVLAAMSLAMSAPVYAAIPALAFVQFPWRFIGVASFALAMAAGRGIESLSEKPTRAWVAAATASLIAIASGYDLFRFHHGEPGEPSVPEGLTDALLVDPLMIARTRHGLFEYLPASVVVSQIPKPPRELPKVAEVVSPSGGSVAGEVRGTDWLRFQVTIPAASVSGGRPGGIVRVGAFRFPEWRATIDGEPVPLLTNADPLSRLHLRVPPGEHDIVIRLDDTTTRRIANSISTASWILVIAWPAFAARRRRTRATAPDAD